MATMNMTSISPSPISSFGISAEVEQLLLKSQSEDMKSSKANVKAKGTFIEHKREERIQNLQDRIQALAQGQNGCLKFLKVAAIVGGAIAGVVSAGATVAATAAAIAASAAITTTTTMTAAAIVSAALGGIEQITNGLLQLQEALKQKKLVLNSAQRQQIQMIITETKKWIEDEKSNLENITSSQKQSLDNFHQTLSDLEESFKAMSQIGQNPA